MWGASPTQFTQVNQLGPEFPRSCSKRVPWGSGERRPPPGWDETTPKVATAPGDSAQARPELDLLPPGLPPRRRLDHPLHRVPPDYRPRGGGHGRGWETSRGSAGALTRDGTGRARRPSLRHCPGHGRGAGQGRTPHAVPCRAVPRRAVPQPRTCRQQQHRQPGRGAQRPHPANSSRRPRCHVRSSPRRGPPSPPPSGGGAEARAPPALFDPRAAPSPALAVSLLLPQNGGRRRWRAGTAAVALRLPAAGQPGLRLVLAAAGAQPGAPRHRPRQPHPPQVRLQPAGPPQPLPGGGTAAPHRERPPRAGQRLAPVRRGLPGT